MKFWKEKKIRSIIFNKTNKFKTCQFFPDTKPPRYLYRNWEHKCRVGNAEETVQDCAAKLNKSIESIQKSKKRIDKYIIYDAHYTDSNNNNKYILENKMSRSKLENSNLKLNTVCKDIQETDDKINFDSSSYS